jgi:hypothetical protein
LDNAQEVKMSILDMNGRELGVVEEMTKAAGEYNVLVNLEKYIQNPGVYFSKIQTEKGTKVMRLVFIK